MSENNKAKFQIKIDKQWKGMWSFGACLSHCGEETYLYVNLFKWSITIGFLYEYEDEYFIDNF